MNTSLAELSEIKLSSARAQDVAITEDTLAVDLSDGRTISVPIGWYPRLSHGTSEELNNWRIEGAGWSVHWPDLDEDVSVKGLLLGNSSGESQHSLKRWLEGRAAQDKRREKVSTHDGQTVWTKGLTNHELA